MTLKRKAHAHPALALRPPAEVMDLARLGRLHPYRLSFMRILMRKMAQERWHIAPARIELDSRGIGSAIYEATTPTGVYSFVVFAHDLDPATRSDRVIAERWDMTATLCAGRVDDRQLRRLARNVPRQEAGRVDARSLVLSRANRSSRNFDSVVAALAAGRQPDASSALDVGYLYRTTAVYGSGKFGMADWEQVRSRHRAFARPFAAEMFACYMIRHFSLAQAEHIAAQRAPDTAVGLEPRVARQFGIGNATGLGMAPYLVHHPQLIARWVEVRESAIARTLAAPPPGPGRWSRLAALIDRAHRHVAQSVTANPDQRARNLRLARHLAAAQAYVDRVPPQSWRAFDAVVAERFGVEARELLLSLIVELYPERVDDLADALAVEERSALQPQMPLGELKALFETHYDWALRIDFDAPQNRATFWYRSAEKMEPRLGRCGVDDGEDKQMPLDIARRAREAYDEVCAALDAHPHWRVADLALRRPYLRGIVRRAQALGATHYGEIRGNLVHADVLPLDLLRCKLSFFGVSKFDPKSRLWVRNTMFQGAPLADELDASTCDDWFFPVLDDGGRAAFGSPG